MALIWVSLSTLKKPAGCVPNVTWVAPVKAVPVMVTNVPPKVGPDEGATAVTAGAGGLV